MKNTICPICGAHLSLGCREWHFICKQCNYEKANLLPTINCKKSHEVIDEDARKNGLYQVRISNFKKLLKNIQLFKPEGGRLLDVGCAHGWFLEVAQNHFDVLGIEPDEAIFRTLNAQDIQVRMGYFPTVLLENEKFDVIIFNDVFEHIPDINDILRLCHNHLNNDGLLVLNLPNSKGVFYRISKLFSKFSFFERLWQKDLPSPHLHYFNPFNLSQFLKNNKFIPRLYGNLSTLHFNGLYKRIAYTKSYNTFTCCIIYTLIVLALPILKILPSDIIYIISKKNSDQKE